MNANELQSDILSFRHYLKAERGMAENSVLAYGRDLQRYAEWVAIFRLAERPHAKTVAVAQRAGNRDHAMQVQLQKIVAGGLAAALESHLGDLLVADARLDAVDPAQSRDVGDRLDIENQNRRQQCLVPDCAVITCASMLRRCSGNTSHPAPC